MESKTKLLLVYNKFIKEYGKRGWWPILGLGHSKVVNKTGSTHGYHPGNYSFPITDSQKFEIMVGAILTQNTSWLNVEKAILNLHEEKVLSVDKLKNIKKEKLAKLIKSSGYHNQKAERLILLAKFLDKNPISILFKLKKEKLREKLLELKGVGPETADSIILYAAKKPSFVVDAYTKRIFSRIGLVDKHADYNEVQGFFEKNLEKDQKLFNEYHALIVEHAKQYCRTKPDCERCIIRKECKRNL